MASRARAEDVALAGGILTAGSSRCSGAGQTESESVQMVGVVDCPRGMPRVRRRSLSSFTVASVRSLPDTASRQAPIVLCGSHDGRLCAAHISVRDYRVHPTRPGEPVRTAAGRIITGQKKTESLVLQLPVYLNLAGEGYQFQVFLKPASSPGLQHPRNKTKRAHPTRFHFRCSRSNSRQYNV